MITFNFTITKFNLIVVEQGTRWVVRDVSWIYSGYNEDRIYASVEGTTPLPYEPGQPFIPIEDITADNLADWLLPAMGSSFLRHCRDSITGTIERNAQIAYGQNPMNTWLPLPSPSAIAVNQEVIDAYLSR